MAHPSPNIEHADPCPHGHSSGLRAAACQFKGEFCMLIERDPCTKSRFRGRRCGCWPHASNSSRCPECPSPADVRCAHTVRSALFTTCWTTTRQLSRHSCGVNRQRASALLGPAVGTGHDTNTGGTQRRRDGQAARSAPRFRPAGSARPHADRRGEPAAGILTTWRHTGGLPRLSCAENVLRSPPATSPARATPPRMRRSQSRAWPRQARRRSRA